jgi:cytochrome P450
VAQASRVCVSHPATSRKSLTGPTDMTAISTGHDAHRHLRMPLEKLFARHSILRIEPRVILRTEKLCARLESYGGSGEAVNLTNAFSSLTTDIISSVIFKEPSDYLSDPDFNDEWYQTLKMGTLSVPLLKHMPWISR